LGSVIGVWRVIFSVKVNGERIAAVVMADEADMNGFSYEINFKRQINIIY
jgi:hypothetical protein